MIVVRTFDHADRVIDSTEPVPDEETAITAARTLVDDAYSSDAARVQGWRAGLKVGFYVDGVLVRMVPGKVLR